MMLAKHSTEPKRSHYLAAGVLFLVAWGLGACSRCSASGEGDSPEPSFLVPRAAVPLEPEPVSLEGSRPSGANLMLIVVDTLRADRMGCYGYPAGTTPEMDRVAGQGILFERLYAASPWTAPSFGTLFTGVSPAVHKTGRKLGKRGSGKKDGRRNMLPLNANVATIGELFKSFSTAAFLTNSFLQPELGFSRGFDHYDQIHGLLKGARRADETVDRALQWMGKQGASPFMALVHFFDPHTAYEPLPEYRERFFPGPAPSEFVRPPFAPTGEAMRRGYKPTNAERRYVIGLYNGELRHVDKHVGRLVRAMEQKGLLDNTWLVITSDHGEEHWDHGGFNHGYQFEDEVTRVPFLIRPPGGKWGAGTRVATTVRHVDLLPTFLDWAGIEAPPYLEGRSVMPILEGRESRHRRAYMEFPLVRKKLYAWFDGRYKLIKNLTDHETYLYDLHLDPLERTRYGEEHLEFDRLEEEVAAYRQNRRTLIRQLDKGKQGDDGFTLTGEMKKVLRNLGYLD